MADLTRLISSFSNQDLSSNDLFSFESSLASRLPQLDSSTDDSNPTLIIDASQQIFNYIFETEELMVINSKKLLTSTVNFFHNGLFSKEQTDSGENRREILRKVLEKFIELAQTRASTFEEVIIKSCELLSECYEFDELWAQAARALTSIPFDCGPRSSSNAFKVSVYIKVMRLYLEAEDTVSAGSFINRVTGLINSEVDELEVIQFKSCQARILDSNRDYFKSALKYYDLSTIPLVTESDRIVSLAQAVKCIVLAEGSPQRSRLLATLYKDERSSQLQPNILYQVLEKISLDRMISIESRTQFAQHLSPHHLAKRSDNTTLLDQAITEHNLRSCSKFYTTIYLDHLASILETTRDQAEDIVGRMIANRTLAASVDQVDQLVSFYDGGSNETAGNSGEGATEEGLNKWEGYNDPVQILSKQYSNQVMAVCTQLDDVLALIDSKYPGWESTQI